MTQALGAVFAVCGGGGSDVVALAALLLVILLWFLVVRIPLAAVEDPTEGLILVGLLVGSVVLGGVVFLYPDGPSGDHDFLLQFFLSLIAAGAIALVVAVATRRVRPGRALLVALFGDVFVPGGLFALLFASLVLGNGCLT